MKVISVALSSLILSSGVYAGCPFGGEDAETDGAKCPGAEGDSHIKSPASWTPSSIPATPLGCECKGLCGTSIGELECDWCYTEGKCGQYDYLGFYYWDSCTYPEEAVADYDAQSYEAKEDYLWDLVKADKSDLKYPFVGTIFTEDIQKTFGIQWDWMNEGREKYIHGVGAVCKIDMEITTNEYTGVLEKGTTKGLIRMGSALDQWKTGPGNGPVPGNGFKFLRTNHQSANWVSLHGLSAPTSGTFNFFGVDQATHIPPDSSLAASALIAKFKEATTCPQQVGLSDAASYTQDGKVVDPPVFPYELQFISSDDAASYFQEGQTSKEDYMENFESMPKGTTLYTVMAQKKPGAKATAFGTIKTTSECTRSDFGDKNLFFRHQPIEEDWEHEPEWPAEMNASYDCTQKTLTAPAPALCYL